MSNSAIHTAAEDPIAIGFEQLYTRLRQKEGRIYSDEEVAILPYLDNEHPHYKEWMIRKNSCKALLNYIKQRDNVLSILEAGCGNGWLSARLADATDAKLTGLDINTDELDQAERVFGERRNLKFIKSSLETEEFKNEKFDLIVFAASIPYFPSLKEAISMAFEHLTLLGEIHIMDSPFYQPQEIEAAKQRTKEHFHALGFEGMEKYYHHHTLAELESFQYKILHHPFSWKNKLSIKKNPFYWITIKNRYI